MPHVQVGGHFIVCDYSRDAESDTAVRNLSGRAEDHSQYLFECYLPTYTDIAEDPDCYFIVDSWTTNQPDHFVMAETRKLLSDDDSTGCSDIDREGGNPEITESDSDENASYSSSSSHPAKVQDRKSVV